MTNDPAGLVEAGRVHRRVYTDPAIFELELARIFGRAWCYVGHESQLPAPGDFIRARIARRELVVVRQEDGSIAVLHNPPPPRAPRVPAERTGHVTRFRCPYPAWPFRTDGRLQSVPCLEGYDNTGFDTADPALAMAPAPRVGTYRGFIFASLAPAGPDLPD